MRSLILKFTLTIVLLVPFSLLTNAQDKDLMAQNYYLQAEDAYNKRSWHTCKELLEKAEIALGKTNSKILDLKIRDINELLKSNSLLSNETIKYQSELKNNIDTFFQITNSATYPKEKYFTILNIQDQIKPIVKGTNFLSGQENDIIERSIAARGGLFNLSQVNSIVIQSTANIFGEDINIITKKKAPNSFSQTFTNSKEKLSKMAFNGTTGYFLLFGGEKEVITDIEVLKKQSLIFEETYLKDKNPILNGKQQIENGLTTYELKVELSNDMIQYIYFDGNNGYIVKDSLIKKSKDVTQTFINEYFDFRQIENIFFPFKIIRKTYQNGKEASIINETVKEIKLNETIDDTEFN